MRRLLASALLAWPAAARAQGLPSAPVWIAPEDFKSWSLIDDLLRSHPQLKLTIALTPAMAGPLAKAALLPWTAAGRLELAARVPGDPLLPFAAAHPEAPRPDDALERAAESRQTVERRLGVGGLGLAPGGGALDASLIEPLGAAGAPWLLSGPYPGWDGPWAAEGKTVFVPARAAAAEDLARPGALVVDESALAEPRLPAALSALSSRARPPDGWATISELIRLKGGPGAPALKVASWPGWDGAPADPPSDASARAAWDAYGAAAKALERYQNSGTADLKVLEAATFLLRRAQDARYYRAPPAGAPAGLPPELRARLLAVYKRIKAPAPESLYAADASSAASVSELPTNVRAGAGPGWISFDNPAGSRARTPLGSDDARPWRLRGLRVDWNDERALVRIFPGRVEASSAAVKPVYDVYIDLNHVLGAGSIRLLEGRGAFAQARDAWEFALCVAGTDARLWRALSNGEAEELAALAAEADPAGGELRVAVPRRLLPGSPSRWGYIALALAEDPARSGRSPAAPLVAPDGAVVLGLIAPLDAQNAVLDKPGESRRVPALRLAGSAP